MHFYYIYFIARMFPRTMKSESWRNFMKRLSYVLSGFLFCTSALSQSADLGGSVTTKELVECSTAVNLNGYVVRIFDREGKTYMEAQKCFIWHRRCMNTEVDFGTTEVTRVNEDYFGSSGSLSFSIGDDIVVFENYEPKVSVTFRKDRCIIR